MIHMKYHTLFSLKLKKDITNKFLVEIYKFTIFAYELFMVKRKNCKKYQNYIYLGQNTSRYIVVR